MTKNSWPRCPAPVWLNFAIGTKHTLWRPYAIVTQVSLLTRVGLFFDYSTHSMVSVITIYQCSSLCIRFSYYILSSLGQGATEPYGNSFASSSDEDDSGDITIGILLCDGALNGLVG